MATSGSQNFSQTRNEVINDALRLLMVTSPGNEASADTIDYANRILNSMIKQWNAQGYRLWSRGEAVIVFTEATASYTLGDASGVDKAFKASGLIQTSIGADEAAAQTSITVSSSTGMAGSDVCFIELDDNTIHVTSISSITNATTIVINDALPSAAASGNAVFTYTPSTDVLPHVRRIEDVRIRWFASGNDRRLTRLDRMSYYGISDKAATGEPTSYYIEDSVDSPSIYFWPVPVDMSTTARVTYVKSLDDMDDASDDFDFPQEWLHCLKYNLAVMIAPGLGKELKLKVIQPLAAQALRSALSFSSEATSIKFRVKGRK